MSLVETLRKASTAELRTRIVEGHPVDPASLEGWVFRGTALGLPRFVEKLTWKTFQKTFYRDPASGRLLGWNVRLHQHGIDAPSRPILKRGEPHTAWHYEVVAPSGVPMPRGFDRGLIIDYARGHNPFYETIRFAKDPLVAVEQGNPDLLLGVSYVALGPWCVETPTYFLLERERRIDHVPAAVLAPGKKQAALPTSAARGLLFDFERRWAELLFDAVLGTGGKNGLPPLEAIDRTGFWRCLGEATPPYFGPGLRATVHALTFLPMTLAGFRRPLFALSREARLACLEHLAHDERFLVRQMLATLKILACFAYFEDPAVRARIGGGPAVAP